MVIRIPVKLWTAGITIYPFVLLFKGADVGVERHEAIHIQQQERWVEAAGPFGWIAWFLLYALALPIGWNPWRWKWEMEAYTVGSRMTPEWASWRLRKFPYMLWWHRA